MNRYIKVRFVKDGSYIGSHAQPFKTSLDVQIGEIVQVTPNLQGVIVGFEVISNILHPEQVKEIVGQIGKAGVEC